MTIQDLTRCGFLPPHIQQGLLSRYKEIEQSPGIKHTDPQPISAQLQRESMCQAGNRRRISVPDRAPEEDVPDYLVSAHIWRGRPPDACFHEFWSYLVTDHESIPEPDFSQSGRMSSDQGVCVSNMLITGHFFKRFFKPLTEMKAQLDAPGIANNAYWAIEDKAVKFCHASKLDPQLGLKHNFMHALDVLTHEFAHGITHKYSKLSTQGEAGALDESIADIFGIMIKQWNQGKHGSPEQVKGDENNWKIGQVFTNPEPAIRRMDMPGEAHHNWKFFETSPSDLENLAQAEPHTSDPGSISRLTEKMGTGSDAQVGHMKDMYRVAWDRGAVHYNSGISNRAFYLASITIPGHTWETTGRIWFSSLCESVREETFQSFAEKTVKHAATFSPEAVESVINAWDQVGVNIQRAPQAAESVSEIGNSQSPPGLQNKKNATPLEQEAKIPTLSPRLQPVGKESFVALLSEERTPSPIPRLRWGNKERSEVSPPKADMSGVQNKESIARQTPISWSIPKIPSVCLAILLIVGLVYHSVQSFSSNKFSN